MKYNKRKIILFYKHFNEYYNILLNIYSKFSRNLLGSEAAVGVFTL